MKPIDPEAKCFFDLPRELRDMIYEFYFINYRRAIRRAKAKGKPFRELRRRGDEFDEEVNSDESDGNDHFSQDSDEHSSDGHSDQDDSDSDRSSELQISSDHHHRSDIPGTYTYYPYQVRFRAYTYDEYQVRFPTYRNEIVINQDQKLHACLPSLLRTSCQLLAETWPFSFDADHKFVIHLDSSNIRPLFERQGVFCLLSDVCGIDKITEENTTVVIHGGIGGSDLKWWLKKHWEERLPLFDTNLEIISPNDPSQISGRTYGNRWPLPTFQFQTEYQRKCLGIIKYMHLMYDKDRATWRALAFKMVDRLDEIKRSKFLYLRKTRHRRSSPTQTPEPKGDNGLIDAMVDAVVWVTSPGQEQDKLGWEWEAESLARDTFRMAHDEARTWYAGQFEAVEQRHRQTALPMNEDAVHGT